MEIIFFVSWGENVIWKKMADEEKKNPGPREKQKSVGKQNNSVGVFFVGRGKNVAWKKKIVGVPKRDQKERNKPASARS